MTKPIILWLADVPGWAYDSIVQGVAAQLPQYDHKVWYVMRPVANDGFALGALCDAADIIVCMFVLYIRGLPAKDHRKVALMLTGIRPFEVVQ